MKTGLILNFRVGIIQDLSPVFYTSAERINLTGISRYPLVYSGVEINL